MRPILSTIVPFPPPSSQTGEAHEEEESEWVSMLDVAEEQTPPPAPESETPNIQEPETGTADFATPALYDQHYVDEGLLKARIRNALRGRDQISLEDLCEIYPIEKGLSEVIAYLHLASRDGGAMVDADSTRPLVWTDADGRRRIAHMPMVVFTG